MNNFKDLPDEIVELIMLKLDYEDVINLCNSNILSADIKIDDVFWIKHFQGVLDTRDNIDHVLEEALTLSRWNYFDVLCKNKHRDIDKWLFKWAFATNNTDIMKQFSPNKKTGLLKTQKLPTVYKIITGGCFTFSEYLEFIRILCKHKDEPALRVCCNAGFPIRNHPNSYMYEDIITEYITQNNLFLKMEENNFIILGYLIYIYTHHVSTQRNFLNYVYANWNIKSLPDAFYYLTHKIWEVNYCLDIMYNFKNILIDNNLIILATDNLLNYKECSHTPNTLNYVYPAGEIMSYIISICDKDENLIKLLAINEISIDELMLVLKRLHYKEFKIFLTFFVSKYINENVDDLGLYLKKMMILYNDSKFSIEMYDDILKNINS